MRNSEERLREFAKITRDPETRFRMRNAFYDNVQRRAEERMEMARQEEFFAEEMEEPEYDSDVDWTRHTSKHFGEYFYNTPTSWTGLVIVPELPSGAILHHADFPKIRESEDPRVMEVFFYQLETPAESKEMARRRDGDAYRMIAGPGSERTMPVLGVLLTAEHGYSPTTTTVRVPLWIYHPGYEGEMNYVMATARIAWTQSNRVDATCSVVDAEIGENSRHSTTVRWNTSSRSWMPKAGETPSVTFASKASEEHEIGYDTPRRSFWIEKLIY